MTDEPCETLIATDGSRLKLRDAKLADFQAYMRDLAAQAADQAEAVQITRRRHAALLEAGWRDDPNLTIGELWDRIPAHLKEEPR